MKIRAFVTMALLAGLILPATATEADFSSRDGDAYQAIFRIQADFSNVSNSWPQLLAEMQSFRTNSSGSKYEQEAQQAIEVVTRMISENATHVAINPANLARLPLADRVRELIFRLRDQTGTDAQISIGGGLLDRWGDAQTNTPAHILRNIGYPAVPQLINAMDDPTFTRSRRQTSTFSYRPLTVGDWAVFLLQKIAGKSFYPPFSSTIYLPQSKQEVIAREAIKAWWAEFQAKGEEQMLIQGTEVGDHDSPTQAEFLIARYPEVALASLIKGTRAATDQQTRAEMVRLFKKFDSPAALAFLEEELRGGDRDSNVAAAEILRRKGRKEVVPVMIHAWEQSTNLHCEALIGFLTQVDSPDAIAALEKNLSARAEKSRMDVIDGIEHHRWGGRAWETNYSKATVEAMEKLLVASLQDDGQSWSLSGSLIDERRHDDRRRVSINNPRICDMAAFLLTQCWPDRYDFDLDASLKVRDRQLIGCQNVWRAAHGALPLSFPPPASAVTSDESTRITAIEWRKGSVHPSADFAGRVEAFRNQLLTSTNIVNLIASYATNADPKTSGLVLKLRKDEDLTGVKLSLSLLPGTPAKPGENWDFAVAGCAGDFSVIESSSWERLIAQIDKAIALPPKTPFAVDFKLVAKGFPL